MSSRILAFLLLLAATATAQLPGDIKVAVEDDWHFTEVPSGRNVEVEVHATVQGNKFSLVELSAGIAYGKRGIHEIEPDQILSRKTIIRTMNGVTLLDVKIRAIFFVPDGFSGHQITWYVDSLHPKTRFKEDTTAQVSSITKRRGR